MTNRAYINIKINQRALVLYAMHGVSREEARSIAAREVAEEERQQRKYTSNNNYTGGSALYRKLAGILERMYGPRIEEPLRGTAISGELALPDTVPTIRKSETTDTTTSIVGMWTGTSTDV